MIRGYLTVYLSLTMAIVLSLCLALIEGTRSNAIRVEAECVFEIGLNSILAEYHQELFSQYNLFAIDSSYGTSGVGTEMIVQHLQNYMDRNFSMEKIFLEDFLYKDFLAMGIETLEMTGASILTDGNGSIFRECAVEAVRSDCNLNLLQDLQQWMQVIETYGLRDRDVASEKNAADENLQKYDGKKIRISDTEWKVVKISNPTAYLETIRREGILKYVTDNPQLLSAKVMDAEALIGDRMKLKQINQGNLLLKEKEGMEELLERFLFQEYLLRYMGYYGMEKEQGALSYQIEYLLMGNEEDVNNLRKTVEILFAVREAANSMYLYGNREKCAEAEALSLLLTTALGVPEAATAMKDVLLFGWSFAESMYDVKTLLSAGRIPLLKDSTTWHFDLQNALRGDVVSDKQDVTQGLRYEDYLRLFLTFVDLSTLTERAMNMVEADIRLTPGNQFFKLDNCFESVEFDVCVSSEYGYQYEFTRKKEY